MSSDPFPSTPVTLLGRLRGAPQDAGAWFEFVDRYAGILLGWCQGRLRHHQDAEDLVQIILARLVKALRAGTYDANRGSFRAYVVWLARCEYSDFVTQRHRHRENPVAPETLDQFAAAVDLQKAIDHQHDQELYQQARLIVRAGVEANTWLAFELTAEQGLSTQEACARLGLAPSTLHVHTHRVRQKLKEAVDKLRRREDPETP
jgi:RNA polymerase sigma-70 factor (ECF subfamily)